MSRRSQSEHKKENDEKTKSKPTWLRIEPDGTRFLTFDVDLTPVQLRALDKIVANIESSYQGSGERTRRTSNKKKDKKEKIPSIAPVMLNHSQPAESTSSSGHINDESYLYLKHKNSLGKLMFK